MFIIKKCKGNLKNRNNISILLNNRFIFFSRDSENIAKFLKKMHIFGKLKEEILGFVGIALEKERKKEAIEKDLSILTQDIREQLIYKAYSNSLEKVKVLTKNFSPEFLQKLLLKVKILEMKPKEIIFEVTIIFSLN